MKEQAIEEMLRQLTEQMRLSAERPNILAYKPHEKQELFHRAMNKGRLYIGGNRGGKTVGGATEAIWWLTGTHPYQHTPKPPVRGRCISVDFTNGVEAIVRPEIQRWIAPSMLINGSWQDSYNTHTRTLTLANGSFLEFKSYDQDLDKHAGTSRHFVWFDEEPPHSIFEENMMRLIDTNGHWWLTMTPVEGYTWVAEELYEPSIRGANTIHVTQVDMLDNPHLNRTSIEEAMSYLSDEDKEIRRQGKFIVQGGLVFPNFSAIEHVVDKYIFNPLDRNLRLMVSMDLGIANPTAFMWHLVHDDGTVFTFHEEYGSGLTIPQWATKVKLFNKKLGRMPELTIGDPAINQRAVQTGLSNQRAFAQEGVYIALGNNDVPSGLAKMQAYLHYDERTKAKWFIHESCRNLIKEMRSYKHKEWDTRKQKDKNNKKEDVLKKNDHAIDACRYLFSFLPDLRRVQVIEDKRHLNESISRQLGAVKSVNVDIPRIDENFIRRGPDTHWTEIETEWGLNE